MRFDVIVGVLLLSCACTLCVYPAFALESDHQAIPVATSVSLSEQHKKAVDLALAGGVQDAISYLEVLIQKHPEYAPLRYDRTLFLTWIGRHREAIASLPETEVQSAPPYVLEAVAMSYRGLKQFKEAERFYRLAIKKAPEREIGHIGLALTLADDGRGNEALTVAEETMRHHPQSTGVRFAIAYAYYNLREFTRAIAYCEKVLALNSEHVEALNLMAEAFLALRAPGPVFDLAREHPGKIRPDLITMARVTDTALRIRYGELPPVSPENRFTDIDLAIAALDEVLKDSPSALRARFDRIVAYRYRYRMADVISEYERMLAEGVTFPVYVLEAVADAYFYLKQPEASIKILKTIPAGYDNYNARLKLFQAYIGVEDFQSAHHVIEELAAQQHVWIKTGDIDLENWRKLEVESNRAWLLAYMGNYKNAASHFSAMIDEAPNSTQLRSGLGHVYFWRGWPRQAAEEFRIILQAEPLDVNSGVSLAYALMDSYDYSEVEELMRKSVATYPENINVQRLKRSWDVHERRELIATFNHDVSKSSGKERVTSFNVRLYASPVKYYFWPFVNTIWIHGKANETNAEFRRIGAGLEYRKSGVRSTLLLSMDYDRGGDAGLSGTVDWQIDDFWSIAGQLDTFSTDIPIKARINKISAYSAGGHVRWRRSDLQAATLRLSAMSFDDGNKRLSFGGRWEQRLITLPGYKGTMLLSVDSSRNSKGDAVYFNPSSDFSVSVTYINEWRRYQRYERSFHDRLYLTVGLYKQANFANSGIWAVRYEHNWQFSEAFNLSYGISYTRGVYDGIAEYYPGFDLTLGWRF